MEESHNIEILLCRPEGSLNIGSVCRAMKTMGISKLTLIKSANLDLAEIKQMALKAFDIYLEAKKIQSIEESLINKNYIVGVTRRLGALRKRESMTPNEFAKSLSSLPKSNIAILFGNEKDGLNDYELSFCHRAIKIDSHNEMPSLNLSHAVQIICYELFAHRTLPLDKSSILNAEEVVTGVKRIDSKLHKWGYYKRGEHNKTVSFLQDILGRAQISRNELNYFTSLLEKIRYQESPEDLQD